MRIRVNIAIFFILLLVSCSKKDTFQQQKGVQLRIENLLTVPADSVEIINPAGRQVYYNTSVNTKSGYKKFDFIYNYAYIKVYAAGGSIVLQPIDYLGEKKIETGSYTYRLYTISNFGGSYLTMENIKD
jgi:hypothetical protein